MKPFLQLSVRFDDEATAEERAALLQHTELTADDLVHVRVEAGPLPDIDLRDFSGVLLGGSPYDWTATNKDAVQRRVEHDLRHLIERIVAEDFPFFGACYGIGTLGAVLGAPLGPDHAEIAGPVQLRRTTHADDDPLTHELPPEFHAFVGHRESLLAVPSDAHVLVTSASAPVQMFRVRENIYATQFHPELDSPAFLARVRRYAGHGYYPSDDLTDLAASAAQTDTAAAHLLLRRFATRHARSSHARL